jgi:hypothetical protein
LDRREALARLARRYLAGHGPAGAPDLARWAGVTLGDARRGLAAIADEVNDLGNGLVHLVGGAEPSRPAPRLLGPFDPVLHGWHTRTPIVGDHGGVVTRNGVFRPVALVNGRVVAIWGLAGGVVTIQQLETIGPRALDALRRDAADVLRFLSLADRPTVVH